MAEALPNAEKAARDEQLRRWNEWQARVRASPAESLALTLQQALDLQMSHRLCGAKALLWMEYQVQANGLAAIHTLRLPQIPPKEDHRLAITRIGSDGYAILEGHHRLAAACLLAYRVGGGLWQEPVRFRVFTPDEDTLRLWRESVIEVDERLMADFSMLRGACAKLGTIREYLADGRWRPTPEDLRASLFRKAEEHASQ